VGSFSPCALLSCTVSPLSVSTSNCTFCLLCVTASAAVFCSMSTVSVSRIVLSVVLRHCEHCCLLKHLHCLSGPHTLPPVGSVSPYPLLYSAICPLLFSTVCPMLVHPNIPSLGSVSLCPLLSFYSLSAICQ